jgi:hypothetical protein
MDDELERIRVHLGLTELLELLRAKSSSRMDSVLSRAVERTRERYRAHAVQPRNRTVRFRGLTTTASLTRSRFGADGIRLSQATIEQGLRSSTVRAERVLVALVGIPPPSD